MSGHVATSTDLLRRRVVSFARGLEPSTALRILRSWKVISSSLNLTEITELLKLGRVEEIIARFASDELLQNAFTRVSSNVASEAISAGARFGTSLPFGARPITGTFNVLNPRILDGLRDLDSRVLDGLKEDIRATMLQHARRGIKKGLNPRQVAIGIRDTLGLAPNQEAAIVNFRRMLTEGDKTLFTRKLRDKRFDGTVRKAFGKDGLTSEQIDKMTDAYRRRMIGFNGQTHAKTAMLDAQKMGQRLSWEDAIDKGLVDRSTLFKRWSAVMDGKTRELHRSVHNQPRHFDEVFSTGEMIPGESTFSCFVPETRVQGSYVGGLRAQYCGEVLKIRTAGGRNLTVTPNHPILTTRGFVPAHLLGRDDDLVCYSIQVQGHALAHPDKYEQPSPIEDVFGALAELGLQVARDPRLVDLHGDAVSVQGQVHIVGADVLLLADHKASTAEVAGEEVFVRPLVGLSRKAGARALNPLFERLDPTATRTPRGGALAPDSGGVTLELLPLEPFRVGPAANLRASLYQTEVDDVPRDAELGGETLYGLSASVKPDDSWAVQGYQVVLDGSSRISAEGDVGVAQETVQLVGVEAKFATDLRRRYPGLVELDRISSVTRAFYRGHVYDLQSVGGWNIAEGIFVSNCRCVPVYFRSTKMKKNPARAATDATRGRRKRETKEQFSQRRSREKAAVQKRG